MPYWVAQFAGAIGAALFLQAMFGHVATGGNFRAHFERYDDQLVTSSHCPLAPCSARMGPAGN